MEIYREFVIIKNRRDSEKSLWVSETFVTLEHSKFRITAVILLFFGIYLIFFHFRSNIENI